MLESLLAINLEPATYHPYASGNRNRDEMLSSELVGLMSDVATPSPRIVARRQLPQLPNVPIPPPLDPGVFRSVHSIRQLIEEASELAIRASSGLSAAALVAQRSPFSSPSSQNGWTTPQSLGIEQQNGGRKTTMSPLLTRRLRVMAVQKLAAAYKADEIATSVLIMQGSAALDNIAELVLKAGHLHLE